MTRRLLTAVALVVILAGCALLALAGPTFGAHADTDTPGCATRLEWKHLPDDATPDEAAQRFGTNGTRVAKRSHDGRVVRVYPVCGFTSSESGVHVDCEAAWVTVVFDVRRDLVLYDALDVERDNYSCPAGDHYTG